MTPGEWLAIQAERDRKNHSDGKWVRCWKDEARDCLYEMLESRQRTAARLRTMRRQLIWYAEHMENAEHNIKQIDIEERRQAVQEVRDA